MILNAVCWWLSRFSDEDGWSYRLGRHDRVPEPWTSRSIPGCTILLGEVL